MPIPGIKVEPTKGNAGIEGLMDLGIPVKLKKTVAENGAIYYTDENDALWTSKTETESHSMGSYDTTTTEWVRLGSRVEIKIIETLKTNRPINPVDKCTSRTLTIQMIDGENAREFTSNSTIDINGRVIGAENKRNPFGTTTSYSEKQWEGLGNFFGVGDIYEIKRPEGSANYLFKLGKNLQYDEKNRIYSGQPEQKVGKHILPGYARLRGRESTMSNGLSGILEVVDETPNRDIRIKEGERTRHYRSNPQTPYYEALMSKIVGESGRIYEEPIYEIKQLQTETGVVYVYSFRGENNFGVILPGEKAIEIGTIALPTYSELEGTRGMLADSKLTDLEIKQIIKERKNKTKEEEEKL